MKLELEKYASRLGLERMGQIMPKRMRRIAQGAPVPPKMDYAANVTAAALHPEAQQLKVTQVIVREDGAKSFILESAEACGKALAMFRPGQFLSFRLEIGGSVLTRAYSICCPPSWAKNGRYMITVKPASDGFAGSWICENWQEGTELSASAPLGEFYYTRLRDAGHVVAVAGGSGITPFCSMAAAIAEGSEDFRLTILYGSRDESSIVLGEELRKLCEGNEKLRLINVLENRDGFVSADTVRKYAGDGDYSLFICGPDGLMRHMEKEIKILALPERRIRRKVQGVISAAIEDDCPSGLPGKSFRLTVIMRDETHEIPCRSDEPLLVAMERAGLEAPSHCRSGECGWCRSKLKAGEVYIPKRTDRRRLADREYGYVHPCCSFPAGDVTLCVGCE